MNTCEEHGSDVVVVFQDRGNNGRKNYECPVCKLEEEKKELETKVEDLESMLDALNDEIIELKSEPMP